MADTRRRDIMAPDHEPTDDELAEVMDAARDAAAERHARSLAHLQRQLEEAVRAAQARLRDAGA